MITAHDVENDSFVFRQVNDELASARRFWIIPLVSGQNPDQGPSHGVTRREGLAFEGLDPFTRKKRAIQLSYEKLRSLPDRGPGKVKEAGFIVKEVLAAPGAIFQGLTEDTDEPKRGTGWLCYVGRPASCFEDEGRSIPPPANRVFLVFVNDEWVDYNWYCCQTDAREPRLPENYASRFLTRLL